MWALQSLLSRPDHRICRLLPIRRHGSQLAAVPRSNNLIFPRGYASSPNGGSNAEGNRQHPAATKRHLYVVLDDHKDSYGIHKLDMDDDNDDLDGCHTSSPRSLPVLPALSVALSTLGDRAQFAAVGSSIVVIGNKPERHEYNGRVLVYDTKTATTVVCPEVPEALSDGYGYEAAIAVGQRLYFLETVSEMYWRLYDECPGGGRPYIGGLHCLAADPDLAGGDELWKWQPLFPSSQWSWSNNGGLLVLPFDADYIFAHAVHAPPGAPHHDVYVSAMASESETGAVTFSFSTARGEWTWHGDWHLPVIGHAHYDNEMDGWLGIHAATEGDWGSPCLSDGHLCAGNITSEPSEWKVGREKLFRLEEDAAAGWRHYDAKLVPMAPGEGGNEYCLMERLQPEGDDEDCLGDGHKWLLRLTALRVERGQDGEPIVTARRQARSYKVSRHHKSFDAQAFWM